MLSPEMVERKLATCEASIFLSRPLTCIINPVFPTTAIPDPLAMTPGMALSTSTAVWFLLMIGLYSTSTLYPPGVVTMMGFRARMVTAASSFTAGFNVTSPNYQIWIGTRTVGEWNSFYNWALSAANTYGITATCCTPSGTFGACQWCTPTCANSCIGNQYDGCGGIQSCNIPSTPPCVCPRTYQQAPGNDHCCFFAWDPPMNWSTSWCDTFGATITSFTDPCQNTNSPGAVCTAIFYENTDATCSGL